MQAEDAEYLERVLEEAKQRKAKLAAYVIDTGASDDYSQFHQQTEEPETFKSAAAEMVPLDMVLSDILEKAKSLRASKSKAKRSEINASEEMTETAPSDLKGKEEDEEGAGGGVASAGNADAGRKMTKAISSNRGLTRCRKKTSGNARVSNRAKYDKKMKKLSGRRMVADAVQSHGGYDGESHGIAIHVNRSRKIT